MDRCVYLAFETIMNLCLLSGCKIIILSQRTDGKKIKTVLIVRNFGSFIYIFNILLY